MLSLFRYSGNKSKLLELYRKPPEGTKRIVELYLGSGAYGLNSGLPCLGYEINEDMATLWKYLIEVEKEELERGLTALKQKIAYYQRENNKVDIRDLKIASWAQTYLKLNVCSAMVGQLSSWKVYPQHSLPIEKTLECFDRVKKFKVLNEDCSKYVEEPGDLVFIDPPYVATSANYMSGEKNYHPQQTKDIIAKIKTPIIFTYGSNAMELFPDYDWIVVKERKVPNLRKGGTTSRLEHVCYINW